MGAPFSPGLIAVQAPTGRHVRLFSYARARCPEVVIEFVDFDSRLVSRLHGSPAGWLADTGNVEGYAPNLLLGLLMVAAAAGVIEEG